MPLFFVFHTSFRSSLKILFKSLFSLLKSGQAYISYTYHVQHINREYPLNTIDQPINIDFILNITFLFFIPPSPYHFYGCLECFSEESDAHPFFCSLNVHYLLILKHYFFIFFLYSAQIVLKIYYALERSSVFILETQRTKRNIQFRK